MVYPALLPLMRAPRLPVVDWTDAPADLNGFFRFTERRNMVSARVPSHFNWPLHSVNSNSRTSSYQFSLLSKKNPIIRIFCISGWIGVPINPDKCRPTVNENKEIWLSQRYRTLKRPSSTLIIQIWYDMISNCTYSSLFRYTHFRHSKLCSSKLIWRQQ